MCGDAYLTDVLAIVIFEGMFGEISDVVLVHAVSSAVDYSKHDLHLLFHHVLKSAIFVRLIVPNMSNFSVLVSHPIRPKAPSATSIPAILKSLQDEWVSVVHLVEVAKEKSTTNTPSYR